MTTTVTVEVDEDELTAAAALLGTSSREETVRKLYARCRNSSVSLRPTRRCHNCADFRVSTCGAGGRDST